MAASPVGVGVVGYGLAGRLFHAPFIAAVDGLVLRAVVTSRADRAALARRDQPGVAVVGSVEALLARRDVEVVVVAAPNRTHAPIGIRALEAGRHVVVDKPIALDVAEAEAMINASIRAGRLLTVYHNRRWDGDFLTLRSLLSQELLGSVDSLEARFERRAPVDETWREQPGEGGGPLSDLGTHVFDQSLLVLGPARRVWAQAARRRPGSQVDDSIFVQLEHENGAWSRHWLSLIASHPGPRLRVRGLDGEYVKEGSDVQEAHLLAGGRPGSPGFGQEAPERWGRIDRPGGASSPVPTVTGDYRGFYGALRAAIQDGGPPPVEASQALAVLRLTEAASTSARTGAVVPLDGR